MNKEDKITLASVLNRGREALYESADIILTRENVKPEVLYNNYSCDYATFQEHMDKLSLPEEEKAAAARKIVELYGRNLMNESKNRYERIFREGRSFNLVPLEKKDFVNLLESGVITVQHEFIASNYGPAADDELCKYLDSIPENKVNDSDPVSIDDETEAGIILDNDTEVRLCQIDNVLIELLKYEASDVTYAIVKKSDPVKHVISYFVFAFKNLDTIINPDVEETPEETEVLPESVECQFYSWAAKYLESGITLGLSESELEECNKFLEDNKLSLDEYSAAHVLGSISECAPSCGDKTYNNVGDCYTFKFSKKLSEAGRLKTARHDVTIYTTEGSRPKSYFDVNNSGISALNDTLYNMDAMYAKGKRLGGSDFLLYYMDSTGNYVYYVDGIAFGEYEEFHDFIKAHDAAYVKAFHYNK